MRINGLQIIGRERSGAGTDRFQAIDPATGEPLAGTFIEATAGEVDCAVRLAALAADDPGFQDSAARSELLRLIATRLTSLGPEVVARAGAETGLPSGRLEGELARTANQLRMFAGLLDEGSWVDARIDRALPERKPVPKPDLRRMLFPIGPVAVFGASNFPLAFSVAGGDTASALAGGNPVIVKAHPAHPGTSELVGSVIAESVQAMAMPAGLFSMLQGRSTEVGVCLVTHPQVGAVAFTGSFSGGRALFDAASRRPEPVPVFAEMGSVNPVFLLPRAVRLRPEAIAEALHQSVTLGVGQFCTNPGLVVGVRGEGWDRFLQELARLFRESKPGAMLHCGIRDAYERAVEALLGRADVRLVAKAQGPPEAETTLGIPAVLAVAGSSFLEHPLLEEVFGPATLLVECADRAELLRVSESLNGQLTASIHGTDDELNASRQLIERLRRRVGRVVFNSFPTGVEVCPSMQHGGPYPATTDSRGTSVGTAAILRFVRPIAFQDAPADILPAELRDDNPKKIWRLVDGIRTQEALT